MIKPFLGFFITYSQAKRNDRAKPSKHANSKRLLVFIDFLNDVPGKVERHPVAIPCKVLFHEWGYNEQKVRQLVHAIIKGITVYVVFLLYQ